MAFLQSKLRENFPEMFLSRQDVLTPEQAALPEGSPGAIARMQRLDMLKRKGVDLDRIRSGRGQGEGLANAQAVIERMLGLGEILDPSKPLSDRLR